MLRTALVSLFLSLGLSVAAPVPPAHACPPGLAKKNPPCVPPGLAGKDRRGDDRHDRDYIYRRGDYLDRRYDPINDPWRYGLNGGDSYARVGNYVYRIDRETREVLDLIGAVSAILN